MQNYIHQSLFQAGSDERKIAKSTIKKSPFLAESRRDAGYHSVAVRNVQMSKKVPLSGFVREEQRMSVGCPGATAAVPSRQVSEWLQQPRKAATGCLARTTIRQLARPLSPSTTPGTWHLALTWYCQAISPGTSISTWRWY